MPLLLLNGNNLKVKMNYVPACSICGAVNNGTRDSPRWISRNDPIFGNLTEGRELTHGECNTCHTATKKDIIRQTRAEITVCECGGIKRGYGWLYQEKESNTTYDRVASRLYTKLTGNKVESSEEREFIGKNLFSLLPSDPERINKTSCPKCVS